jgi:hypothetical protein
VYCITLPAKLNERKIIRKTLEIRTSMNEKKVPVIVHESFCWLELMITESGRFSSTIMKKI